MQKFQCEEFEIMDAHTHIFPSKIAEKATVNIGHFYDIPMAEEGNAERLLQCGAKIGTKRYLVCSTATTSHQVESINDFIAEECGKHPEFYGFGTLHPDYADLEGETNRIIRLGLHGIKLHPDYQGFFADEPRMLPIYRRCAQLGLPVLFHAGFDPVSPQVRHASPAALARIAEAVPELTLIAAHLGGMLQWDEAERLLVGRKNVYLDTAFASHSIDPGQFERIVQRHGAERILFASDCPWDSPVRIHRIMDDFALTPAQRSRIDWENALELLEQY